jgi:hypothetical protein
MFHFPCINQIQKYIINEQVYLNIYNVFYLQYSPYYVSKQEIRNIEKEKLFAMAWRWNGQRYCIRDVGDLRRAKWLATSDPS